MERKGVYYLLLGLIDPTYHTITEDKGIIKEYKKIIKRAGKKLGIEILPVCILRESKLTYKTNLKNATHAYMFKFTINSCDANQAQKIADAIISSFTLIWGPFPFEPAGVFQFPTSFLKNGKFLLGDDLLDLDRKRQFSNEYIYAGFSLNKWVGISIFNMMSIFDIVQLMMEEDLSKAMKYLRASYREFYVFPGVVTEILAKPEDYPISTYDQSLLEDAMINAFKAIEALIGDPPRNDIKFFKKLISIGVNPNYEFSYPIKKSIHEIIREMNKVRDKRAAHGSIRNQKAITFYELMDYQFCSRLIILKDIKKRLGRQIRYYHKIVD